MRMSMMVRRDSSVAEIYAVGTKATRVLSAISGISDILLESQYIDRATLSFNWEHGRPSFDSRPDFNEIDRGLQSKGMHRMQ
jgi:hypothetical protein